MRCFYVLVHGKLDWAVTRADEDELDRPAGFYCHRFVLAQNEAHATEKAFSRVRENLDERFGWLSDRSARLTLEAEELSFAPMHKLLKRENRSHAFYDEE
jgi:hypothetical protein